MSKKVLEKRNKTKNKKRVKKITKRYSKKRHIGGVLSEQFIIPEEGICGIEKEAIQNILYKSDPFEALGLSSGVTKEDIKKRYKNLALKIHPDKCYNSNAHFIFQYLQKNYIESLKNVEILEKRHESERIDSWENWTKKPGEVQRAGVWVPWWRATELRPSAKEDALEIENRLIEISNQFNEIDIQRLDILKEIKFIEYDNHMMRLTIQDLIDVKSWTQSASEELDRLYDEYKNLEQKYINLKEENINFEKEIIRINKISIYDNPVVTDVRFKISKLIDAIDKKMIDKMDRAYGATKRELNKAIERIDKIIEKKERGTFRERIAKTITRTIRNRKRKTKGGKKNKTKKTYRSKKYKKNKKKILKGGGNVSGIINIILHRNIDGIDINEMRREWLNLHPNPTPGISNNVANSFSGFFIYDWGTRNLEKIKGVSGTNCINQNAAVQKICLDFWKMHSQSMSDIFTNFGLFVGLGLNRFVSQTQYVAGEESWVGSEQLWHRDVVIPDANLYFNRSKEKIPNDKTPVWEPFTYEMIATWPGYGTADSIWAQSVGYNSSWSTTQNGDFWYGGDPTHFLDICKDIIPKLKEICDWALQRSRVGDNNMPTRLQQITTLYYIDALPQEWYKGGQFEFALSSPDDFVNSDGIVENLPLYPKFLYGLNSPTPISEGYRRYSNIYTSRGFINPGKGESVSFADNTIIHRRANKCVKIVEGAHEIFTRIFIAISEFGFEPTKLRNILITGFYPQVSPTTYAMRQLWINYVSNMCIKGESWTPDGLNGSAGPFEEFKNVDGKFYSISGHKISNINCEQEVSEDQTRCDLEKYMINCDLTCSKIRDGEYLGGTKLKNVNTNSSNKEMVPYLERFELEAEWYKYFLELQKLNMYNLLILNNSEFDKIYSIVSSNQLQIMKNQIIMNGNKLINRYLNISNINQEDITKTIKIIENLMNSVKDKLGDVQYDTIISY